MRVLFRCDSSRSIGVGHVARVSALAESVRRIGGKAAVVGDIATEVGMEMLTEAGVPVIGGRPHSTHEVANMATQWGADIVHLDSYLGMDDMKVALDEADVLLSSIEDGAFGRRHADIVVDPTPGAELNFRHPSGSRSQLRGIDYLPLRRSVIIRRKDGAVASEVRKVMVALGGTDFADLSLELAARWAEARIESECYVLGGKPPEEMLSKYSHVQFIALERGPLIADSFAQMDLVICSASTAAWELAYMGIPTAILQVIDNQAGYFRFMRDNGIGLSLGDLSDERAHQEMLDQAVQALRAYASSTIERTEAVRKAQSLVDGHGASRVIDEWERLLGIRKANQVSVRPAHLGDASQLYSWRTDRLAVEMSRTGGEIDWGSHIDWLQRLLLNDSRHLLIAEDAGGLIGTVRYDHLPDGEWEVSITIAPERRKLGLAAPVLRASEQWLQRVESSPLRLRADFRETNLASRTLFQKAGYKFVADRSAQTGWLSSRKVL